MASYPKVSIIILNWNNLADTLRCLESVHQMDYPNYNVILVDNGSMQNPKEIIEREFPEAVFFRNEKNLGYTGGNNLAMQYALEKKRDYVWLLNNDTIVDPKCLTNLIKAVQADPKIGLASPIIFNNTSDYQLLYCGNSIDLEHGLKHQAQDLIEIGKWQVSIPETICLWGTALLIKSDLIHEIGLFDNTFFAYSEDMDYSIRSIQAGHKNIIVINAHIFHEKKSANYPAHFYFYMTRNDYFFWRKYLSNPRDYYRKFIGNGIRQAAFHYLNGTQQVGDAIVDGIWNAAKGKHGDYNDRQKIPIWLHNSIAKHPRIWRRFAMLLIK